MLKMSLKLVSNEWRAHAISSTHIHTYRKQNCGWFNHKGNNKITWWVQISAINVWYVLKFVLYVFVVASHLPSTSKLFYKKKERFIFIHCVYCLKHKHSVFVFRLCWVQCIKKGARFCFVHCIILLKKESTHTYTNYGETTQRIPVRKRNCFHL